MALIAGPGLVETARHQTFRITTHVSAMEKQMTRIEHLFDPDTVRRVYARIDRERQEIETMRAVSNAAAVNVISLAAYRQKIISDGGVVVS